MSDTAFRPRDREIIDFVIRYRLATNIAIGSRLLTGRTPNAVAKVTARLRSVGLLSRYTLIPPETYFRLGPRAVAALGLSPRNVEPLGPQALPTDYATLIYAIKAEVRRRRLTPEELSEYMPWLPAELSQSPYCLDAQRCLELIRVDLGGSPRHVARKVAASAHDRLDVPQVAELAARSRFQVVVLTTSDEKAKAITKALAGVGCSDSVRIHFAVIPRLSLLLLRAN